MNLKSITSKVIKEFGKFFVACMLAIIIVPLIIFIVFFLTLGILNLFNIPLG